MNIYAYADYKEALRAKLAERKQLLGSRFTYERLAYRIGMQKSYFSRVLRADGPHLSEDQLYALTAELGFNTEERQFLHLLLEHDRSGLAARRSELAARLAQLRASHQRSEAHIAAPAVDAAQLAEYFLNPDLILVHMFLCVARFRGDLAAIGGALGIGADELTTALAILERLGLIQVQDGSYTLRRDQMHLPSDSPLYRPYRALQRLKSLERCQRLPSDRAYSFSVAFTADEATRQAIKDAFLSFLTKVESLAQSAPDTDVFQMNFDLFDWSR